MDLKLALAGIVFLGCASALEQKVDRRLDTLEARLQAVEEYQAKPPQETAAEKYWREKGAAEYQHQQQKANDPLGQKVGFYFSVYVDTAGRQRLTVDTTSFTGTGYDVEVRERRNAYCTTLAVISYNKGEVARVVSIDEALGQVEKIKIEQNQYSVHLFLTEEGLQVQPPILNIGEAARVFRHHEKEYRTFVQQYEIERRINEYAPQAPAVD
ncbi:hypothetical protein HYX14_00965 [Candidatus Woesearchaeota archaeon]|nr:hypothetical protein [Candidatus Woesearchaeota archaeon]